MTWNDHDHRGEYAEDRHDHDLDYAEKHHRHYDLETDDKTAQQGITRLRAEVAELRGELDAAYGAVRDLRHQFDGVLAEIRVLDRLRPSCVLCRDATADRQTVRGPACTDCVGDPPDDGPDPDRPETWVFGEAPETTGWHDMPDPEESQA
jgi:hypothetical protein